MIIKQCCTAQTKFSWKIKTGIIDNDGSNIYSFSEIVPEVCDGMTGGGRRPISFQTPPLLHESRGRWYRLNLITDENTLLYISLVWWFWFSYVCWRKWTIFQESYLHRHLVSLQILIMLFYTWIWRSPFQPKLNGLWKLQRHYNVIAFESFDHSFV